MHEVGDGARFIRVDRDGRGCGRHSLLQEALRNAAGVLERVDQQLYDLKGRPLARLRCTRFENALELDLEGGTGQRSALIPYAGDCLLSMPGILLAGMALSQAAGRPQPVDALQVFQVGDGFAWERLPLTASCAAPVPIETDSGTLMARACSWDGSGRTVWLDSRDVALRLEGETCRIELSRYARRHG